MHDLFSLSKTWQNYDSAEQIKQKTDKLISIIPKDVKTILDVGCGNGIITNELAKKWEVTGLDNSFEALKYVTTQSIKASATKIPCADEEFDLILSSELLEHLSDSDLTMAVIEMSRLCKKYILITVPFDENLEASYVMCPVCNITFHAWQHHQNFDFHRMEFLFKDGFELIHQEVFGPLQMKWIPLLLKIRQSAGQWFSPGENSICPHCGYTRFSKSSSNIITKACNGLNKILSGKQPYWMMVLFQKK